MEEKLLATGRCYRARDCKEAPPKRNGHHCFADISQKKVSNGVYLVTSKCKFCGGIVKDVETLMI